MAEELGDVERMLRRFVNEVEDGVELLVFVKPEARFTGLRIEAGELVFYTEELGVAGRENASLVNFLSRLLGVSPSQIDVVEGARERLKRVRIRGRSFDEVSSKLAEAVRQASHQLP